MQAVRASGLCKTYSGDLPALKDFDLVLESGEVFGLLGPNGAGKTTTVRLLNGTLEPSEGDVSVFDRPAADEDTRRQTATLAEMANIYEHLSAVRNLQFYAAMYGLDSETSKRRIHELIGRMGLSGREHDKVGAYSTGMKKRLQLARILLHEPKLVFLDEPTSGLDPEAARQVTELIRNLSKDEGTTVILCTHNLPVAEQVCDTFGFLSKGRLIAFGSKASLINGIGREDSIDVVTANGTTTLAIESREEINGHLRKIMYSGSAIYEVKLNTPDLESLYFEYVAGGDDEQE